ncbi:MAG: ABC transporter ATP-binding protein [Paracoccaceae bacterium]
MKVKLSGKVGTPDSEVRILPLIPTVRRVARECLRPHLKHFLLAVVAMIVAAVATAALAFVTRDIVNEIFVAANPGAVWLIAGTVVLISLAKGGGSYFQVALLSRVERNIVAGLEQRLFANVIGRRMDFFAGKSPAQHMSQISFYATSAANLIMTMATAFIRDLVTLAALLAVMVSQDPLMSAFALVALPFVLLGLSGISRNIKNFAMAERSFLARVMAVTTEALGGIRVVKSFQLEPVMIRRAGKAIRRMQNRQNKIKRITAIASPLMETISGLIIAAFVIYASWQNTTYGKSPGEFVAFITAFLLAYEPAKKLANVNINLQRALVAVSQMYDLLDHPDPDVSDDELPDLDPGRGDIRFDHVSFGFGQEAAVLDDVSFHVKGGERVALVGRSGAGKSTIVNLILQLLRGYDGSITVNGSELSEVSTPSIRGAIGFVGQQTFLFDGTVRENIGFGRPDASDEQIVAAAKAANAHDFITALADGYQTEIGSDGELLSGGQRQRIAIARALIKDAPIMLMDEATSALDGESEHAILSALRNLTRGRTSITVAHRLSTIMSADRIILLDRGRIEASGTHEELSRNCELYRTLFLSEGGNEALAV